MSPERSNSPQDEAVSTPKMSVPASPIAGTPIREAQSPISLLLAVAQSQNRNGDDDLTSLSWLHERDLLKGMNINPSPSNSVNSTPVKYSNSIVTDQFAGSDYTDDNSISAADSSNSSLNSPVSHHHQNGSGATTTQQRNKHPHHIPYDPLVHTNNKPPFSFSCLIFMAIEESPQKALPVKEIYAWIVDHFPYFKNAPTGWKNSVRHNLSLNKCFQKVEKAPNLGKGSLWTVEDQYKPNLINALTKSPFQPTPGLDPSIYLNNKPQPPDRHPVSRLPNPELYPYLSKKLSAEMNRVAVKAEASDESLDAADAAAVMLSLKNGPRYRQKKEKGAGHQIITTSPSQDHTYSAAEAVDSADADSDDERIILPKTRTCRKIDFEDEEERKIKEGAETLLNLAGISTRKRHNSSQTVDHQDLCKRFKPAPVSPQYDINENESNLKPAPFKPRLLRNKKKDAKLGVSYNNNNNNNSNNNNNAEWVKHRRDLEINQQR